MKIIHSKKTIVLIHNSFPDFKQIIVSFNSRIQTIDSVVKEFD